MTEYKSRFLELGFYVDGTRYQFQGGRFVTEESDVISVLDALPDADRVDQPEEAEKPEPKAEEPEVAAEPARKSSAK
ncbi:hypothetical protein [Brevibacillus porteri]|uniref:hypothetical protein n=1 Tax=Brevibacillus porteri TaxID=2126350 RepID=UPI003D24DEAC